ncbi:MAG: type II toxin-antitoxin system HicB family antitoxin [Chitinispirillaceae bacterium]
MNTNSTEIYSYNVLWSERDQEYVGFCAEFPKFKWLAPTPESALSGIREVINEIVSEMKNQGEPVPEPITNRIFSGQFTVQVLPEIHRKLALEAAMNGVSFDKLVSSKLISNC